MEEKYQNVNDKTNTEGKNNIETYSGSTLYKINNQLDINTSENDNENNNNEKNVVILFVINSAILISVQKIFI